ncbi:MAG: ATP-binding cassette domain-containing protein [Spirochaetaceae bacterium]|nr:ATP-binding cassette domain-containing protein [Spirochaetaceae bacterium]
MTNDVLLSVKDVGVSYDALKVVFDVSLTVEKGKVVFLSGRNGSGKTTLFKTISGFLKPNSGEIKFRDESIISLKPFQVALKGVKYVHQDKSVFSSITVKENLELGSYATKDQDWDRVLAYVPKIKTLFSRKAGNLSGGEKQMLLIAMALLGKPDLLLLDEPTEGLAPHVVNDLTEVFEKLKNETTLFIIEQNLPMVAKIADKVYAMKEGHIVAEITDQKAISNCEFEKYL